VGWGGGGSLLPGKSLNDLVLVSDDAHQIAALRMGADHKVWFFNGSRRLLFLLAHNRFLGQRPFSLFLFEFDGFQRGNPENMRYIQKFHTNNSFNSSIFKDGALSSESL
jgi:hypothetical protein